MSEGSHNLLLLNKVLVNFFIFLGCVFHPYTQFLVLVLCIYFLQPVSYMVLCLQLFIERERENRSTTGSFMLRFWFSILLNINYLI